ncbi:hypothetical protein FACS1894120_4740 [Clostridia bacterium]|nr:hypothetical protein FACS1894120_4740 [Clostridia bacterium]
MTDFINLGNVRQFEKAVRRVGSRRGMTLVELIIAMSITAVLIAMISAFTTPTRDIMGRTQVVSENLAITNSIQQEIVGRVSSAVDVVVLRNTSLADAKLKLKAPADGGELKYADGDNNGYYNCIAAVFENTGGVQSERLFRFSLDDLQSATAVNNLAVDDNAMYIREFYRNATYLFDVYRAMDGEFRNLSLVITVVNYSYMKNHTLASALDATSPNIDLSGNYFINLQNCTPKVFNSIVPVSTDPDVYSNRYLDRYYIDDYVVEKGEPNGNIAPNGVMRPVPDFTADIQLLIAYRLPT